MKRFDINGWTRRALETGILGLVLASAWSASWAQEQSATKLPEFNADNVAALIDKVASGQCDEALEIIAAWGKQGQSDPDVLTLEGNCRLHQGKTVVDKFNSEAYERQSLVRGLETLPGELKESFTYQQISFDPDAAKAAKTLFKKALKLAPKREDLIVGNVALLASIGDVDAALSQLQKSASDLSGPSALREITRDLQARGSFDDAMRFATTLDTVLPSPFTATDIAQLHLDKHQARPALTQFETSLARGAGSEVEQAHMRLRMYARDYDNLLRDLIESAPEAARVRLWLALVQNRLSPGSSDKLLRQLRSELAGREPRDLAAEAVIKHYVTINAASAPPTPVMRLRAARNFLDKNLYLPAIVEADHALADDPKGIEAAMLLVDIYRQIGLFDLGVEAIDIALERFEGLSESERSYSKSELLEQRGLLLLGMEVDDQAARDLAKAAELGAPVQYELAIANLWAGKQKVAIGLLEKVQAAGGHQADAAQAKLQQLKQ